MPRLPALQTRPPALTIVEKWLSQKNDKEQTGPRSREQQAEIETASASNGSEGGNTYVMNGPHCHPACIPGNEGK
jgi:hypothetical protein